jgi:very-short-patch-repair endonuclease
MANVLDVAIAELASEQHSVFSYGQALDTGFTVSAVRHRLAVERWQPVRIGPKKIIVPRVYHHAGAPVTWHGEVMAAVLWGGPGTVASHRTSGALKRLDGFKRGGVIDITVPRGRYPQLEGVVTHRSILLGPADIHTVDGIPATRPVRLLIESGLVVPKPILEMAYEDCERRGWLIHDYTMRHLERLKAPLRRGSRPFLEVMLERDPSWAPTESVLETGTWDLLRDAGFLLPERQFEITYNGKKIRLDFAYPDLMIAIEADGFRWHHGRLKWGLDRRRAAILGALGWRIIPVTWSDVCDPTEILPILALALPMAAGVSL